MLLDNGEPSNYEETMAGPDSNKWLEAMKSEIGSMYENINIELLKLMWPRCNARAFF